MSLSFNNRLSSENLLNVTTHTKPDLEMLSRGSRTSKRSITSFEYISDGGQAVEIGKGSYGTVFLVKEKASGMTYALKTISKVAIKERTSVTSLKREIKLQKKLKHPNIIELVCTFEDETNVYMVLEYAPRGTLFHYLRSKGRLNEEEALIIFKQTCMAVEFLHQQKIIHRDLKPENILLDVGGNVKLCDFGWAAEIDSDGLTGFCGTIEYMPPEMIQGRTYDQSLDIWCLGILLYELLCGHSPFRRNTDKETCERIVSGEVVTFTADVSEDARNLIQSILSPFPQMRPSFDEIFLHPWMQEKIVPQVKEKVMPEYSIFVSPTKKSQRKISEGSDNFKQNERSFSGKEYSTPVNGDIPKRTSQTYSNPKEIQETKSKVKRMSLRKQYSSPLDDDSLSFASRNSLCNTSEEFLGENREKGSVTMKQRETRDGQKATEKYSTPVWDNPILAWEDNARKRTPKEAWSTEESEPRVSRISKRNTLIQERVKESTNLQRKPESFFDRLIQEFSCLSRDKKS